MEIKYPDIKVKLLGENDNMFHLIGRVRSALQRAGISDEEVEAFSNEAMLDDYDNALYVIMQWVTVK